MRDINRVGMVPAYLPMVLLKLTWFRHAWLIFAVGLQSAPCRLSVGGGGNASRLAQYGYPVLVRAIVIGRPTALGPAPCPALCRALFYLFLYAGGHRGQTVRKGKDSEPDL